MTNSALWRVLDNDSGTEAMVSTPAEAVAFINSRFDTDEDDEPFGVTEVGPFVPKPLGVITAWAARQDDERTDGRMAPITIRPVVTDGAIDECDDVGLWGDVQVIWDHDIYTVNGPGGSEYSVADSAAELNEILDEYAADYEYVEPERSDGHARPSQRELIRHGAQERSPYPRRPLAPRWSRSPCSTSARRTSGAVPRPPGSTARGSPRTSTPRSASTCRARRPSSGTPGPSSHAPRPSPAT